MKRTKGERKVYQLSFSADTNKKEFNVFMRKGTKLCWKITFNRKNLTLKRITAHGIWLYIKQKILKKKIPISHQMPESAVREQLHMIFPYIPIFTNFKDFLEEYEHYNMNFSEQFYVKLEKKRREIQYSQLYAADGRWHVINVYEKLYLYCKWEDADLKQHVVMLEGQTFLSDLSYSEIISYEKNYIFQLSDLSEYIQAHPLQMLDAYVNAGGLRIFFFLTSRYPCHAVELLGKAGFAGIADAYELLSGINVKAASIEQIFHLPFHVIKTVARSEEQLMLFEPEERALLKEAYVDCKAVYLLPFSVLAGIWLRYYYRDATMKRISKLYHIEIYDSMRYLNRQLEKYKNAYLVFFLYQNYLIYSLRLKQFAHGLYPKDLLKAVAYAVEGLNVIYEERKKKLYQLMVMRPAYQQLEENLSESQYCIVIPDTPEKLLDASKQLHNCLNAYVYKITYMGSMVLLIKEKENNQLIGAVEVKNNKIVQAGGVCNQRLPPDVKKYVNEYAVRKNLF